MIAKSAREIKQEFYNWPDEFYDVLTFGDLREGDKFISLPTPDGGFKKVYDIFKKIERISSAFLGRYNAVSLKDGTCSMMPDTMPVIKVE